MIYFKFTITILVAFIITIYLGKVAIEYYFDRSRRRKLILLLVAAIFVAVQTMVYMVIYEN